MAQSKSMSGARARLMVDGKIVGTYASCDYGLEIGLTDIYTLGKYGAQEIAIHDVSTVTVSVSGFRVIGESSSPHGDSKVPKLQDLLNAEDISLAIFDRKDNTQIMFVIGARPASYNQNHASRSISGMNLTFRGLTISDESGDQEEVGSTKF
jgi:hypothetical protein